MCENRGERRKQTFRKALHNLNTYKKMTGSLAEEFSGEDGRFKKDKHLKMRSDYEKTNSKWFGKDNFKHGEKKVFISMKDKEVEYKKEDK